MILWVIPISFLVLKESQLLEIKAIVVDDKVVSGLKAVNFEVFFIFIIYNEFFVVFEVIDNLKAVVTDKIY